LGEKSGGKRKEKKEAEGKYKPLSIAVQKERSDPVGPRLPDVRPTAAGQLPGAEDENFIQIKKKGGY